MPGTWIHGTVESQLCHSRLSLAVNSQPSASCTQTHTVLRAEDLRMTAGYSSPWTTPSNSHSWTWQHKHRDLQWFNPYTPTVAKRVQL